MRRKKTNYPGVFYREATRIGGKGTERVYYIVFKKDGKVIEEKVGRQYLDHLTPARAARIRIERIEGRRMSRKEIRERQKSLKRDEVGIWTVSRLWSEYTANRTIRGIAQDRSRFEKYIKPALGEKEPLEILLKEVDQLRLCILEDKSPQTVKNILELLRRIINFGVKRNLCKPLSFMIEMPKTNNLKTEDLTPEQLARLLKALGEDRDIQVANLMRLALYTGMRRGELFRLRWEDIDFRRGFIHIRNPKGGKDQIIPLNDAARTVLEDTPRISQFVFPCRKGEQRTEARRSLNRIKRRADLPDDFRPLHGLRHVFASMLASSGQVDLYTLQRLLTHQSPQMTQRYAHLRDEALRRASNLAGSIIEQTINGESNF